MEKVRKANCIASKSLQLQLQVLNYDVNMIAVVPRRFFVLFEQLRTRYDFFFMRINVLGMTSVKQ